MFIPETKISDSQVTISKTDWPRSGWIIRKKTINDKIKNETKYEKFKFLNLFELIILEISFPLRNKIFFKFNFSIFSKSFVFWSLFNPEIWIFLIFSNLILVKAVLLIEQTIKNRKK